jgi:hypothetical protein
VILVEIPFNEEFFGLDDHITTIMSVFTLWDRPEWTSFIGHVTMDLSVTWTVVSSVLVFDFDQTPISFTFVERTIIMDITSIHDQL